MKKLLIFFFINIFAVNSAYSVEEVLTSLKEGGKIIFIRHALAPGNGDPENFDLNDCSTQRNLNQRGIEQSKFIGNIFNKNQIKIENVYSSEWCRCIDTAKFAFKNYQTFSALNSFYDIRFEANEERQITQLKEFINQWNGKENIIFVTHFVVISSMLNIGTSSGEIVITDKNLNIIGSIDTL
jgi:phosphohistidine phosphatase SixA